MANKINIEETIDILDFVERYLKIKLLPYQKEFLRRISKQDEIFIIYPPRIGYVEFKHIMYLLKILLNRGDNNE